MPHQVLDVSTFLLPIDVGCDRDREEFLLRSFTMVFMIRLEKMQISFVGTASDGKHNVA